jgi:integrase
MVVKAKAKRTKPVYCELRNGIFVYRRDIPDRWQEAIGQTRWKVSLKTGNEVEATRKARALAVDHDSILERLERDGAAAYLRDELANLEAARAATVRQAMNDAVHLRALGETPPDPAMAGDVFHEDLEKLRVRMMRAAERSVATISPAERAKIAEAGGLMSALAEFNAAAARIRLDEDAFEVKPDGWQSNPPLPPDLPIEDQLREHALRGHARAAHEQDKAARDHLGSVLAPTRVIPPPKGTVPAIGAANTISAVFDKWLTSEGQRDETARKWKTYKRRLVDVIGDKPVRLVTKADIRDYVETVAQLPDAATLPPASRAGTVQSLLDWAESEDEPKLVSAATVGKHLDFARAFFRWCSRQDYAETNPAQDIQAPKDTRDEDDLVRPFTRDELKALAAAASDKWGSKDRRTFITLVGIYTGARLEEICQLAPGNLERHGDFHAIRVDAKGGRQLKNDASRRVIPLPDALVATGFVDFAQAAKGDTIFDLTRVMGRYGRSFSPFFRRLRDGAGLSDPRLRFHSLRHSYADLLRVNKVPVDVGDQLMGHVGNRVREGYGTGYDPETLYSWVKPLEPL